MSLSTFQKVYEKAGNEFIERLTNYQQEGYNLKFPEYFLWRVTGAKIYSQIKENVLSGTLNLDFIENAIPDGEGETEYLEPIKIKDQMEVFEGSVSTILKKGNLSEEDNELLESALADSKRLHALCEFCSNRGYLISIGLDA